jgi:hypothetical protein
LLYLIRINGKQANVSRYKNISQKNDQRTKPVIPTHNFDKQKITVHAWEDFVLVKDIVAEPCIPTE